MADTQVKGVSITATTVKELKAEIEKLRNSLIQLSEADENYDETVLKLQAHQARLTEVMSLTSKETMAQVKALGAVEGSYDALVAKGAKLRAQWRTLKIGTAEWQKQAEAIRENEERLIKADEAIGRHQRKVGNYAGAISPLTAQVNQLVREVPSLAVSANQFFLAISNNLPMFVDEVKRFQQAQKELAEQGKATQSLIGTLGKSLISWQTLIVLGISLLSKYGGQIWDAISSLWDRSKVALKEANDLVKNIENALAGVSSISNAQSVEALRQYTQALKEANGESEKIREATEAYNRALDKIKLTEAQNQVTLLTTQLASLRKKYEEMIDSPFVSEQEEDELYKRIKETEAKLIESQNTIASIENKQEQDRQKRLEDAKKAEQKATEEALKLRKQELEQIGKWNEEAVNSLKSEQDREVQVATTAYGLKLALYQKYGQDTTALTEAYNRQVEEINKKYRDKEAEEARRIAEKASADAYEVVQTEVEATNLKATEAERYANLLISNEGKLRERLFSIKQSALNDELSILQKSLQNDKIQGEERIAIAERVAQIQRDLAFNTAEYEKKVSKDATDKKNANTQSALQVASASASAMSSILGSIADMYEAEGEQNEEATKKAKNLRIAGATMDMLGGLVSAWTSALNPANSGLTIWGQIAMATLTSATILASGIANIQKIKNTDTSGNSSGGGIGASVSAPAIVQQVPVTRTLTGVAEEQRLNEGQRVYVVYDDIAQAGRKVDVTESEATF